MSLFGSLMGDFEDDLGFMGNHMNAMNMQMRSMNRLMNSLMPDPFNMLTPFDPGFQQNALMERGPQPHMGGLFGFPAMPNMNRLLSGADFGTPNGASYCSSSVVTMSSGPDGRPQIYQATSSSKTGPGGIRETRKTVQDSTTGVKKMAIGHHIGERAHIIEKEQDTRSGQLEERQEFINLDEDEAEDFDREFSTRARGRVRTAASIAAPPGMRSQSSLTIEPLDDDDDEDDRPRSNRRYMPALPAPPQHNNSSAAATVPNATTTRASNATTTTTTTTPTHSDDVIVVNNDNNNSNNNNNNNNYMTTTPRRAYQHLHHHHHHRSHHLNGVQARRPLRTPSSSPLTTTPTAHSHSIATSPSVHPHPYNVAAARRNHRSKHNKQHKQQQQQQQQQQTLDQNTELPSSSSAVPSHSNDNSKR